MATEGRGSQPNCVPPVHGGFVHVDGEGVVILAGVAELGPRSTSGAAAPRSPPPRAGSVTDPGGPTEVATVPGHRVPGRCPARAPTTRRRWPPGAPESVSRRRGPPPGVTAGRGPAPAGMPGRALRAPATRRRLLVAMTVAGELPARSTACGSALGGSGLGRIDPHVTLVPPVNVREEELPEVLRLLRGVAAEDPAEVVLGPARTFAPRTPGRLPRGGRGHGADRRTCSAGSAIRRSCRGSAPRASLRPARHDRRACGGTRIAAALDDAGRLPADGDARVGHALRAGRGRPRHPWHVIADVALGDRGRPSAGEAASSPSSASTILDPEAEVWADATPGEDVGRGRSRDPTRPGIRSW